jgi:transaldolase
MKFFLDTAESEAIKKAIELGMCDGITTNPSLILKSGKTHKQAIAELNALFKGPISIEGIGMTAEEMVKEAEEFKSWADEPVMKVPMTTEGLRAVRMLAKKDISTNVTLVFSSAQALLAAKAGASYVSPFVGRLDDIGQNGMTLIEDIMQIYDNYMMETEVIVASVRSVKHVEEAAKIGADIATIPPKVYEELWKHSLTDKGIAQFIEDHKKWKK